MKLFDGLSMSTEKAGLWFEFKPAFDA